MHELSIKKCDLLVGQFSRVSLGRYHLQRVSNIQETVRYMETYARVNQLMQDLKGHFLHTVLALPPWDYMPCKERVFFLRDLVSLNASFT